MSSSTTSAERQLALRKPSTLPWLLVEPLRSDADEVCHAQSTRKGPPPPQVLEQRRALRQQQMGTPAWTSTPNGQHVPAAVLAHAQAARWAEQGRRTLLDPRDDRFGPTTNVVGNRMVLDAEDAVRALLRESKR